MNDSNVIRLKAFCQFKKGVRDSTGYLIVGLDIAKEKQNAFFGNTEGHCFTLCVTLSSMLPALIHFNFLIYSPSTPVSRDDQDYNTSTRGF